MRAGIHGRGKPVIRRLMPVWFGLLVSLLVALGVVAGPTGARARQGLAIANVQAGGVGGSDYCNGCRPPLRYLGGPVLDTLGPLGLTVTPIYWAPPGAKDQFPSNYMAVINGYIANVAAASGANTNVYSIDTEYYDLTGGLLSNARYHITAGSPVVDTRPLPRSGCRPASAAYSACITDGQLVAELKAVIASRHLPEGLANFYPVFFPPGVETGDGSGSNSISDYCGYHANGGSLARQIVYSNEPYETTGCGGGQAPNDNVAADGAINTLSHELNEATTDPETGFGRGAWQDHSAYGYEMGDMCGNFYGRALGSTDPGTPQTTEYNQVINGGRYYTQTEFSDYAYRRFGVGKGCQPSEAAAQGPSAPTGSSVAHIYSNLSPNTLPANGRRTSAIFVQEWDKNGYDIPGDRISFSKYALSGSGNCGSVRPRAAVTDGAGTVTVTYRASRSNVACVIVASDAKGGRSVSAVVYQGRTRKMAPRASLTTRKIVTVARPSTLTTSFTNPMRHRIADTQVNFWIYAPGLHSPNVRAGQLHLSASQHGRGGPFVPVALTGSTGQAGIFGVIGGTAGFTFPARRKLTLTYRITVSRSVPRRRRQPILQFEAFLEQVNPASGAETVLADTGTKNVKVR